MASGTATPNPATPSPAARNTPREILPPTFTAVDERRFESEIRRIDTTLSDERKNREKFETEVLRRFDKVDARFEKVEERFDKVDARFEKVEERFEKVEERFDKVDACFEKVEERFEKIGIKFDKLNDKMDSHFRWMMGFLVGTILIPIALRYFAK